MTPTAPLPGRLKKLRTFLRSGRPGAVVVPVGSLVERPAGTVVYVLDQEGGDVVREQVVQPGERQDGLIEIVAGLEPGQTVVGDGAYYLSDGARIQVRGSGQ